MNTKAIDWSQLVYPGPHRAFTADEMLRAGADKPSPTLLAIAGINVALMGFVVLQMAPARETARLTGLLIALAIVGWRAARWLWWRPWRRPLMGVSAAMLLLLALICLGLRWRVPDRADREWLVYVLGGGVIVQMVMQWFLVVWRAQQIEARLTAQAEREKAIEMARRLAAAQLEPHFLFNTLASVQHWVDTGDARAAPLLAALTGYLRATLPLFNRPLLAVAEELRAIDAYLQVMQARLGPARLAWRIDVDAALHPLLLPPGLLLTLVENAVQHGIEPQLQGGVLTVHGTRHQGHARLQVTDNGAGPPPQMAEGVGLANARQRLALTCGAAATLTIAAAPGGGCLAEIRVPLARAARS